MLEKEVEPGDDDLTYDDLIENGVRFVKKNKFDDGLFFRSNESRESFEARRNEFLEYIMLQRNEVVYTIGDFKEADRKKGWSFFTKKTTLPPSQRPREWNSPPMSRSIGSVAGRLDLLRAPAEDVKQKELEAAQRKLKEFAILKYVYRNSDHYPIALLQHYGVPTTALDVTYDPLIALWFACHRFVRPVLSKGTAPSSAATYEMNPDEGVVYLLKPIGREYEVEDLTRGGNLPIAGLRGVRQRGGLLLGATKQKPDLSHLAVHKVYVAPGTFNPYVVPFSGYNQKLLFPPPLEDHFYRELLAARHSSDVSTQQLANFIVIYESADRVGSPSRFWPRGRKRGRH
jgi:hypothetical protein